MNLQTAPHAGAAPSAAAPTSIREFLAFKLGNEEYGIDILRVQEIRSYEKPTRIANAPEFIKGVVNLRGVIVPIIDMRLKLKLEQAHYDHFTVVIVLNIGQRVMGMVVDAVSDVITLARRAVAPGAGVQRRPGQRAPAGHRRRRRAHADPGGHREAHVGCRDRPGRSRRCNSPAPAPTADIRTSLKNLRISTQLSLLVGVVSAMLLGIGLLGLYGMSRSSDALRTVYEDRAAPIEQLADMNALQLGSRLALAQALLQALPAAEAVAQIEGHIAQAGKLWALYMATPADGTGARARQGRGRCPRPLRAGRPAAQRGRAARQQPEGGDAAAGRRRCGRCRRRCEQSLDALSRLQLDEARTQHEAAMAHAATLRIGSAAGHRPGRAAGRWLRLRDQRARSARQLGAEPAQAAALAQRVAAGELDTPIALRDGDRSSLMAQLKTMQSSLGEVVGRVRQNADSVATASRRRSPRATTT